MKYQRYYVTKQLPTQQYHLNHYSAKHTVESLSNLTVSELLDLDTVSDRSKSPQLGDIVVRRLGHNDIDFVIISRADYYGVQQVILYTGIYEFNPEIAEKRKYVNKNLIEINYSRGSLNALSNQDLTNDENRLILASKVYGKDFQNLQQILEFTEKQINFINLWKHSINIILFIKRLIECFYTYSKYNSFYKPD